MASGSSVYRAFGDHRDQLDNERRTVADRLYDLQQENEQALREEADLWRDFAALHLAEPVGLPPSIQKAMDDRKAEVERLRASIPEHERLMQVATKQAAIFREKMAALKAEIDAEEASIRAVFVVDPRVSPLLQRGSQLQTSVENFGSKRLRAVAERDEKRVPFEKDELFMYLRHRKFGTSDYRAMPFIRAMDRRLANRIGFEEANSSFERLLAMPGWFEGRMAQLEPDRLDVQTKLAVLEKEFFDGLLPKRDALRELGDKRDQADGQRKGYANTLADINQFLSDAALAQDQDLKEITRRFADILERSGVGDLAALAQRTSTDEDDKIARRIQQIERDVRSREIQADELQREVVQLERKIASIKRIEREIDNNNWNGSGHTFSGVSVEYLVRGLVQGVLTEALIVGDLEQAHRSPPPPPRRESTSGGFGGGMSTVSTRDDDDGFGGGFGGGSSIKTGGGFGGGSDSNFRTGGGFGG